MRNLIIIVILGFVVITSFYFSLSRYRDQTAIVFINTVGVHQFKQDNTGYFQVKDFFNRFGSRNTKPKQFSTKLLIKNYDEYFKLLPEENIELKLEDIESKDDSIRVERVFLGSEIIALDTYPRALLYSLKEKKKIGFFQRDFFNKKDLIFDPYTNSLGYIEAKNELYYFNQYFLGSDLQMKSFLIDKLHRNCDYDLIDYRNGHFLLRIVDRAKAGERVLNPEHTIPDYYYVTFKQKVLEYTQLPLDKEQPETMRPFFIKEDGVIYCNTSQMNLFSYYVYDLKQSLISTRQDTKIKEIDRLDNQYFYDSRRNCFFLTVVEKEGRLLYSFRLFDSQANMVSEYQLR